MTGLLSLHDLRNAMRTPSGPGEYLTVHVDEARINFLTWLNDPGSADEWPYREPVGSDNEPEVSRQKSE